MEWPRIVARAILAAAGAAAIAVPPLAVVLRGSDQPETWVVTAGSLAVVAAVLSAWSSRRVAELQEDAQRPNPYPAFDFQSRYGLVLLRVRNTGGTAAHDLSLEWDVELTGTRGRTIGFFAKDGRPGVTVLPPGESISQVVDGHSQFLEKHPDRVYTGHLTFKEPSGRRHRRPFRLDGRPYAETPSEDDEALKTHRELQSVPKQLERIAKVMERVVGP